jgi:hypothetical protein
MMRERYSDSETWDNRPKNPDETEGIIVVGQGHDLNLYESPFQRRLDKLFKAYIKPLANYFDLNEKMAG